MVSRKVLGKDETDFESSWTVLATAFTEIHHKNASQLSFEELFRSAYKLVLKKRHEELYNKVTNFERVWLRDTVKQRIVNTVTPAVLVGASGQSTDLQANERRLAGERFMISLKDAFQDQHMCMNMITDVLMYMVSSSTSPPPLRHDAYRVRIAFPAKMAVSLLSTLRQWPCFARRSSERPSATKPAQICSPFSNTSCST